VLVLIRGLPPPKRESEAEWQNYVGRDNRPE
jgi:hypothetical protein